MANPVGAFWEWLKSLFGNSEKQDKQEDIDVEQMLNESKLREKRVAARVETLEEKVQGIKDRKDSLKKEEETGFKLQRVHTEWQQGRKDLESAKKVWMNIQDHLQVLSELVDVIKQKESIGDTKLIKEKYNAEAKALYVAMREKEEALEGMEDWGSMLNEATAAQKKRYAVPNDENNSPEDVHKTQPIPTEQETESKDSEKLEEEF